LNVTFLINLLICVVSDTCFTYSKSYARLGFLPKKAIQKRVDGY